MWVSFRFPVTDHFQPQHLSGTLKCVVCQDDQIYLPIINIGQNSLSWWLKNSLWLAPIISCQSKKKPCHPIMWCTFAENKMFLEFAICKSRTWIKRIKEALSLWMRGFSIIIDAPTVLTVRYYYSRCFFKFFLNIFSGMRVINHLNSLVSPSELFISNTIIYSTTNAHS